MSGSMQTTVPSAERWLSAFSISQLKIIFFEILDLPNVSVTATAKQTFALRLVLIKMTDQGRLPLGCILPKVI